MASMYETIKTENKQILVWNKNVPIDKTAIKQMQDVAALPFVYKHVAAMPDAHTGIGAAVGSVVATEKAIIPAAVGVDIGCGMMAYQTNLKAEWLPDNLKQLRRDIEKVVPRGTSANKQNKFAEWKEPPPEMIETWIGKFAERYHKIVSKHPAIDSKKGIKPYQQLGTLGSGNHFVELCLDQKGKVWVMLHTGSRNTGNRIGRYFISLAKEFAEKNLMDYYLPDKNLAYFAEGNELFSDYIEAMLFAQSFAEHNRIHLMNNIFKVLKGKFPDLKQGTLAINCHHNYAAVEKHYGKKVWVTRKGAVNAETGTYGIIPGSMATESYIVQGKGNKESFNSCSHGAGRAMSRTMAKKSITMAQHKKACQGVECRTDADVLDESPAAYKDINAVIKAQSDLITVKAKLKQVLNIKG